MQIAEGEIFGAISHPEGGHWSTVTVNFTDDPEPYNTHATISRLKSAIQNSAQRGTALKYMNTGVASSKDFVQKVRWSYLSSYIFTECFPLH